MTRSEKNPVGGPRRVNRGGASALIPLVTAIEIAGEDRWTDIPESTRKQYERQGVPASQLGSDLWDWYQGLREPGVTVAIPSKLKDRAPYLVALDVLDTKLRLRLEEVFRKVTEDERDKMIAYLDQQAEVVAMLAALTPAKATTKRKS